MSLEDEARRLGEQYVRESFDLLGKKEEEKHAILKQEKNFLTSAKLYSLDLLTPTNWSDDIFMKRLGQLKQPNIASNEFINIARELVTWLFTGTTNYKTISSLFTDFVLGFVWVSEETGDSSQPMQFFKNEAGVAESAQLSKIEPFSTEAIYNKLTERYQITTLISDTGLAGTGTATNSNQQGKEKLLMTTTGLTAITLDELKSLYDLYIELISVYCDASKGNDYIIKQNEEGKSYETSRISKKNSISFMRSLYLFTMLILQVKAKDYTQVLDYLKIGKYRKIAEQLLSSIGSEYYSVWPIETKISEFSFTINTGAGTTEALFGVLIYSDIKDNGYAPPKLHSTQEEAEKYLMEKPRPDSKYRPMINFTRIGLLMRIQYKGLLMFRIVEELSRTLDIPHIEVLAYFATTKTMNRTLDILTQFRGWYQKILKVTAGADQAEKYLALPQQLSYKYARVLESTAYANFSNQHNLQLLYRMVSVYGKSQKRRIQIRALSNYHPTGADESSVDRAFARLFGREGEEDVNEFAGMEVPRFDEYGEYDGMHSEDNESTPHGVEV